jgi:choline dehydrogenase-like flavoprotein
VRESIDIRGTVLKELYDVIVVGSGAGGGMCSHVLTSAGMKVLILEAGRDYDPVSETPMFNLPKDAPLRGAPTPDKPYGFYDATVNGGWQLPGEPYTLGEGSEFQWWRPRMLGGRTNHWGRVSLRYGPYDFKPYSRDGLGVDWPLSYEELAPWYDKTESLIGVTGARHGLENTPDSPPGVHLPPPPPSPSEYFVSRGFQALGIPVAAARLAILTRPLNGRAPCFYATPCIRGCSIGANFQSVTVLISPARKTGNLTVRTDAMVYQVDVDKKGRAKGVSFVDRKSGQHHSVEAKAIVLAASTCESARILLNSKSSSFPNGLANENGLVGRHLMDSVTFESVGQFPALEALPPRHDDGLGGGSASHIYVPWWGYQQQGRKELDFARGYHIETFGGRKMPGTSTLGLLADDCDHTHGSDFRDEIRRRYGSYFYFLGNGEMIPNEDCYCEIDPSVKDRWGIPVLRFHWKWGEQDLRQATHMRQTFRAVIERLGGKVIESTAQIAERLPAVGGSNNHEVGTIRMGIRPDGSVVNSFGRTWSTRNLFVMDGSVFASSADKNPTLTILALAWRNSAHLIEEARKGNL